MGTWVMHNPSLSLRHTFLGRNECYEFVFKFDRYGCRSAKWGYDVFDIEKDA
ncbi:hypothetical protein GRAN_1414 [Granulicella sibirica]|uniref:Uncharacterized protein n=1 Tax=Granulicella sibirica TaxID=2479048 RepID=A0A4V1L657_9BACT|nr:hypothetical protein GRAN_1414 [Granulicella sibirica]